VSAASVDVVLVHYRTPHLVRPASEALLADLNGAGIPARLWLVDNGSQAADRVGWLGLPLERLEPGGNVGYAAALTLAVRASSAPRLVVVNPDVLVRPGCLPRLLAQLDAGAAAAGPRFVWDEAGRFLLPPTEARTLPAELIAAAASRGPRWAWLARRRWRRHARLHWQAVAPLASRSLSGALLAFRRDAWERVGPFDAAYRLYFEESDWLERLRRAGLPSVYEPGAAALHLYAQSSLGEPAAAGWFAESAARFRQRRYGPRFAALLARLERASFCADAVATLDRPALAADRLPGSAHWIEVASSPLGFPAAAEPRAPMSRDWQLPAAVWDRLAPGSYWLRAVASGRELGPWRVEKRA